MSPASSNEGGGALYVISAVSLLHLGWAALLASSAAAAHSNPVAAVASVTGSRGGAAVALAVTAILALAVAWVYRSHWRIHPGLLIAGLVPQQFFLIVSAASGIVAATRGHYADGTVRSWPFIVTDQSPVILIALLYTTAILVVSRRSLPD
jgi:hypothetical protein